MEEDEQGEEKKMTRMDLGGRNDMTREGTHVYIQLILILPRQQIADPAFYQ